MKELWNIKRFRLYGWIGLGVFGLCTLVDLGQHTRQIGGRAVNELWIIGYVTIINYFFFEYSLPRLQWKKFGRSFWLVFLQLFILSEGVMMWRRIGIVLHIYTVYDVDEKSDLMSFSAFMLVFIAIIRLLYNHYQLRKSAQQLLIQKQAAELNYLKSQTNPHFLFNTLNNIYALARDKSDLAPETILRLSKILRYMLYEAGGEYIAIEQELKIIGDYISLEQLRYDDSLRVNFNYDVEDMKQALPPLLLIPLVENAFKHGVSETRSRPFVDIHLQVVKRQLAFFVRNSTEETTDGGKVKENIGLSNLRRQLELQYTDYQVSLEQRPMEFSATLKINLASHV
jgi:two-component system LytT family sensor kinase